MGNENSEPEPQRLAQTPKPIDTMMTFEGRELLNPYKQYSQDSDTSSGRYTGSRQGSNQQLFLLQPTSDYESFQRYINHLNRLIRHNLPFLKVKFGITSLQISAVLTNSAIIPENLKKKFFDSRIAQTAVLVQFTRASERAVVTPSQLINEQEPQTAEPEDSESEFVFIRKFQSVNDFIERVRSLDTVLENIESFSTEVRQLNGRVSTVSPQKQAQALLSEDEDLKAAESDSSVEPSKLIEEADNKSYDANQVLEFEWSDGHRSGHAGSELNICCICLEKQIECVLTCFHAYCRDCIDEWKARDPTCPLCREQENGNGDFDLLSGPDRQMREQIRQDFMRQLSRIIGELLGEAEKGISAQGTTLNEQILKGLSPDKKGVF